LEAAVLTVEEEYSLKLVYTGIIIIACHGMIEKFPVFHSLELEDKDIVESFVGQFAPYSDFNFVSLFSWDADGDARVCWLNDNLVFKFPDYVTEEFLYTFLGTKKLQETIETLLTQARSEGVMLHLKLIPQEVVDALQKVPHSYHVYEDPDNHDYILSVEEHATLPGKKYKKKRNMVRRFEKEYGHRDVVLREVDLRDVDIQGKTHELFHRWTKVRQKTAEDVKNELGAFTKLLEHAEHFTLHSFGLFVDGVMEAFTFHEPVGKDHVVTHFEKTNPEYIGIGEYFKHHYCEKLHDLGKKFINYEQDLGDEGLKQTKHLQKPTHLLKKYCVALSQAAAVG